MYTLTIRPEDAKYFMEAQEKLGEAIILSLIHIFF